MTLSENVLWPSENPQTVINLKSLFRALLGTLRHCGSFRKTLQVVVNLSQIAVNLFISDDQETLSHKPV